jgi:integrase
MNEHYITKLKWEGKDKVVRVEPGLYVNIRKNSRTYLIRKTINGKKHVITLGPTKDISLKEARLQAAQYALVNDVSKVTVSKLIEQYRKDVVDPNSKVPGQVYGYLNHIDECFGNKKAIDVERFDLVNFIKEYSSDRGARSADRVRSYLKQLFSYGVELGYLKESNPMEGVTKRVTGYIAIDRKRVLTDDEIRMVWSWVNPVQGWQKTEDNARVIKFLLLTGLRINEARIGYVKGDKFVIDDTKGKHPKHEKVPHWVYLTESAASLLPLPKCTATNIQAWLKRKLEAEGYKDSDRFVPHDCRRTFSTRANGNKVEPFIVERVLNHKLQGMMGVYNTFEYEEERIECAKVVEAVILDILK